MVGNENFNEFYSEIDNKDVTTAMLQEFLFFNRDCENILDHLDSFMNIIQKNKPKNLKKKEELDTNNLYM